MSDQYRPDDLENVTIAYTKDKRIVTCFCGQEVSRSIVPHLKAKHSAKWQEWTETFVELRALGYPWKRIMRLFKAGDGKLLFSWTVIERAVRQEVETGKLLYVPPPKQAVVRWQPEDFALETTTVWDFPNRGDWAVHSGDYRGNWPPQIPRNLIERYTQEGDLVVEACVGGGTTLLETWLLRRQGVGLDISKLAIQTTNAKLNEMERLAREDDSISLDPDYRPKVIEGNVLELTTVLRAHDIGTGQAKLVCIHPPYLDALKYTTNNSSDLALISDPDVFCERMRILAREARQALSADGICGVLIGDVRKSGKTVPLGLKTLEAFLAEGFALESIVVKMQHKDRSSEFYVRRSSNTLLLAHEYLFILRNVQPWW